MLVGMTPLNPILPDTRRVSPGVSLKRIANWYNENKKNIDNWVLAPTNLVSAGSGVLSFLLPLFWKKSKVADTLCTWSTKAAVLFTGIVGILENGVSKNLAGTLGYCADIVAFAIGNMKTLYPLKAFGSAFDTTPAMQVDAATNPRIKEKYGENFINFEGFVDSGKKTCFAIKIITQDIINEFKQNKFTTAFMNCFIRNKRGRAERNIFVSNVGLIATATGAVVSGFNNFFCALRDVVGIYANVALLSRGYSKDEKGKAVARGNLNYWLAGIFYSFGDVFDFMFRYGAKWIKLENLNLIALGLNRLGSYLALKANATENEESAKKVTAENRPNPKSRVSPAFQPT